MSELDPVAGLSSAEQYIPGLLDGSPDRFVISSDRARVGGIENEIEFNGTLINRKTTQDKVVITSIDGLADPDVRDTRENNPGFEGETAFSSFYGGRTIVLNGFIKAGTLNKLRDMQEGLKSTFAVLEEAPLVFRGTSRRKDLVINCRKTQPITMAEVQSNYQEFKREFQITLRASDFRFTKKDYNEYSWKREYTDSVKEAGPAMFLRLNETSGTVADDSSGFDNPGTISGATYTASGPVIGGAAYQFDGTNDYVSTEYMPFASGGSSRTFEAWIKRDNTSSTFTVIGSNDSTATNQFSIAVGSGTNPTLTVKINGSTARNFTSTGLTASVWHHIAVVVDLDYSELSLYVDGNFKSTIAGISEDYSASPGNLLIGKTGSNTNYFNGYIAEVAVYESALEALQITSNYRAANNYLEGQVFVLNVTNNGNYFADTIIKVQGPVYSDTLTSYGLKIINNFDQVLTAAVTSQDSYLTSSTAEIYDENNQAKLKIQPNDQTIINPKPLSFSHPYEVIGENEYLLINGRKKTVNRYNATTNQLIPESASAFDQVNFNSEWLKIAPGNNPIYIDCTYNSRPLVSIYFKDTFI